jgi:hypothetical protein
MDETSLFAEYVSRKSQSSGLMKDEYSFHDLQSLEYIEAMLELCPESSSYNIFASELFRTAGEATYQ